MTQYKVYFESIKDISYNYITLILLFHLTIKFYSDKVLFAKVVAYWINYTTDINLQIQPNNKMRNIYYIFMISHFAITRFLIFY